MSEGGKHSFIPINKKRCVNLSMMAQIIVKLIVLFNTKKANLN